MLRRSQISLYKRHTDHAGEVLGRLLEAAEHAAAFLQPTDQTLHDVSLAVGILVKDHRSRVAILIGLRRNHRPNPKIQQIRVDPIGAIAFVERAGLTLPVAGVGLGQSNGRRKQDERNNECAGDSCCMHKHRCKLLAHQLRARRVIRTMHLVVAVETGLTQEELRRST